MLLKPYKLTMKTVVVVMANNARHAEMVARENSHEIVRDGELESGLASPVNSLADLTDSWDGECIPYGWDGNTRLKELLPPNDQACRPPRVARVTNLENVMDVEKDAGGLSALSDVFGLPVAPKLAELKSRECTPLELQAALVFLIEQYNEQGKRMEAAINRKQDREWQATL